MGLKIVILGFTPESRELVDRIKRFPGYGLNRDVYIYHIQVIRNSLSYGPKWVVEIPDPHGDGYRTYNDGFQAVPLMSTTVSDFDEWLLTEARAGTFNVVLDCTRRDAKFLDLINNLKSSIREDCYFYEISNTDDAISWLQDLAGIEPSSAPAPYSEALLKEAANLWEAARSKMKILRSEKPVNNIKRYGNPELGVGLTGYAVLHKLIPTIDIDEALLPYVIEGASDYSYSRYEEYIDSNKCLVIRHEMLDWFFSDHCAWETVATYFCRPNIETASTKYVRYDSDDSTPLDDEDYDYAFEYVISGVLELTAKNGSIQKLSAGRAYGYSTKINAPVKKVQAGLQTMIFYYKEKEVC